MTDLQIEPVARALLGAPNRRLSKETELRYGNNGSLKVDLATNCWFDFEVKDGGGVLDLIKREVGVQTDNEAFQWLERESLAGNTRGNWKNGNGSDHSVAKLVTAESYEYLTASGDLALVVDRREFQLPGGTFEMKDGKRRKTFSQRRPDPERPGQWFYNAHGVPPLIYRLLEVVEAIANGNTIYAVEGERKANALWAWGVPATCCPGGAKKWLPQHSEFLRDADVVVLPDNDAVGLDHLRTVFASLAGIANRIEVVELPDLPPKGDIVDWMDAGHTREQFDALPKHDAAEWASGKSSSNQVSDKISEEWSEPDWSLLDDRRGQLPEFPIDALSPECRGWVKRAAHGAGVTTAHVATPLIGISSSLIGTARRAMASRSFTQPLTCWTATVGFSGTGKTPGIDATKRALAFVERARKEKIEDMRRSHEARVQTAKAVRDAWKKQIQDVAAESVVSLDKYRAAKAEPIMPREAIDPGPFVAPRLHISNATIERLAQLLEVQPQGALLLSDELASLFLNMSRYSGGQDNEFWLEAWNGGHYTVERMSRPAISIDHLLVGVVGGMQPDKLARSFKGDLDGMTARVLFSWPPEPAYQPLAPDIAELEPEIVNALTRLVELKADGDAAEFAPRTVSLSSPAVDRFEQFRRFVHVGKRALDGREREWWAKMPAHVLRLAGTLCFLDWAFVGGPEPAAIGDSYMEAAVRLMRDYFWPHARACLRQIGLSDHHKDARRVLRWIRSAAANEISVKDIRRDALAGSLDATQTETLLNNLAAAGWLRRLREPSGRQGGRPVLRWIVNPAIHAAPDQA